MGAAVKQHCSVVLSQHWFDVGPPHWFCADVQVPASFEPLSRPPQSSGATFNDADTRTSSCENNSF